MPSISRWGKSCGEHMNISAPRWMIEAIDEVRRSEGITRSACGLELVVEALRSRGYDVEALAEADGAPSPPSRKPKRRR